jgi:hypothetical protein
METPTWRDSKDLGWDGVKTEEPFASVRTLGAE